MVRARDVMYGILVVAAATAIGGYTNQIMYPAEAKDSSTRTTSPPRWIRAQQSSGDSPFNWLIRWRHLLAEIY